jgi:hypothetical protein
MGVDLSGSSCKKSILESTRDFSVSAVKIQSVRDTG